MLFIVFDLMMKYNKKKSVLWGRQNAKLFNDNKPKNAAQLFSHAKNVGLAEITDFIDEIKRSLSNS